MTLKRQQPKPVDWSHEAKASLEREAREWFLTYIGAVRRRMYLFEFLEVTVPAKEGKRDMWNKLDWYIKGKKIPWAPKGFLG